MSFKGSGVNSWVYNLNMALEGEPVRLVVASVAALRQLFVLMLYNDGRLSAESTVELFEEALDPEVVDLTNSVTPQSPGGKFVRKLFRAMRGESPT